MSQKLIETLHKIWILRKDIAHLKNKKTTYHEANLPKEESKREHMLYLLSTRREDYKCRSNFCFWGKSHDSQMIVQIKGFEHPGRNYCPSHNGWQPKESGFDI